MLFAMEMKRACLTVHIVSLRSWIITITMIMNTILIFMISTSASNWRLCPQREHRDTQSNYFRKWSIHFQPVAPSTIGPMVYKPDQTCDLHVKRLQSHCNHKSNNQSSKLYADVTLKYPFLGNQIPKGLPYQMPYRPRYRCLVLESLSHKLGRC